MMKGPQMTTLGRGTSGEDTHDVSKLIETLAEELERPREVPPRVSDHIWGTYEVDRETVGDFLEAKLSGLEEYEQDLILSPLFTPKLADQALFAELLGKGSVPKTEWPALVQQLAARPTRAQFVTNDKGLHTVTLPEVILERYVHRLRLDGAIPEPLWRLLEQEPFAADRPTFKAIARRAIWESDARGNILSTYLTVAGRHNLYHSGDGVRLLRIAEDYKPKELAGLMERILQRQKALRQEIETAYNPKPFFSAQIQANHGFDRDQRQQAGGRISEKQNEFEFLNRLHQVLCDDPATGR
jgi:hypothetical protein